MNRPPALNAKDLHAQGLLKKTAREVQAYVDWLEAELAAQRELYAMQSKRHQDEIEDVTTIMNDCMPSPQYGFWE